MNKTDKIWVALLVAALLGYLGWSYTRPEPVQPAPAPVAAQTAAPAAPAETPATPVLPDAAAVPSLDAASQTLYTLENDQVRLTFSSVGGRLIRADLLKYREENREDSASVILETGDLLNLSWPDLPAVTFVSGAVKDNVLTLTGSVKGAALTRAVTLEADYRLTVKDTFCAGSDLTLPAYTVDAGSFFLGKEQGDVLGADALADGESKPEYYESALGKLLGAGSAFLGCGTSSDVTGIPLSKTTPLEGNQSWVALKDRFFVTLLQPPAAAPATLTVARDAASPTLKVNRVSAAYAYPAVTLRPNVDYTVTSRLYVGPKKHSFLSDFGSHAGRVMDFGFFTWVCVLLLPILNFFYAVIPNYGVAIILLTLLVRIVFWPLTHKSTVSMRKMGAIQPEIKALREKFKDNPQKLQQETFRLYREHQVNPFSSCLPLLIQIPIFIALFTVLRSAVELRFAPFLWISDLSQPENLFAGILPVPLNILPILTAITMGLQTHLSPSTGDPAQKKMMTWMMPIMLLFVFYSMPSALCLYWTVSQVLSILQMWQIQRSTAREQALAASGK